MILVDYSNIAIPSILVQTKYTNDFDENLIRHIILNCLLSYRKRFFKDYGELVLCCDGGNTWRKDVYPYYKAGRKAGIDKSPIDWGRLLNIMTMMQEELKHNLPYKVVKVVRAEGDDVIATICKKMPLAKHMIVSNDKDFGQLQYLDGVRQWAPLKSAVIKIDHPMKYLKELIIRGDGSDGVPNILSDDDVIVTPGKRQKPIKTKLLEEWLNQDYSKFAEEDKIKRNQIMISFDHIPTEIEEAIWDEYNNGIQKDRRHLLSYLSKNKLRKFIEEIQFF